MIEWISSASSVALIVAFWLFLYVVVVFWIYIYRYFVLNSWLKKEIKSTEALLGNSVLPSKESSLYLCAIKGVNPSYLKACYDSSVKETTAYLTPLSAIASTAPFVGLFGTVVGVLQAFAGFKEGVTLSIVAPAISEALIVTAMGIVVAIPAYWAHLLLKRKAYEVANSLKVQMDLLLAQPE